MWINDLRFALRLFLRNPGFTAVAVLTLALGIGANAAIFSLINGVLLRPSIIPDADRLAIVWETDRNTGTTREPGSLPDFLDYQRRSQQVRPLGAFVAGEVNYALAGTDPLRLQALTVSDTFFDTLGLGPSLGRVFTAADTQLNGPAVAVVSDAFWAARTGRDPSLLGRSIRLDDAEYTVVGIMPPGADTGVFQVLERAAYSRAFADRGARAAVDLWLPLQASSATLPRTTHPLFMIGRVLHGLPLAQQELAGVAADLERDYPENAARGVFVEPFDRVVFGPVRPALLVLLGAVSLVLLVACANVANLLLARGTSRQREVAVRTAIGGGTRRLAAQFAVEGLLLTVAATAIGVTAAGAELRLLVAMAPADLPRIADARLDWTVLTVMLAVTVVVGLVFGLVPLTQVWRLDLHGALKPASAHGATPDRRRSHLRSALIVGEFALAVVLAVGAGLLVKSFWRLQQVDPGFAIGGILKAEYRLPASRYPADFRRFPDFREMHAFTHALLRDVGSLPGVVSVAVAGNHPLDPGFTNSFEVVGREAEARRWPEISIRRVTPAYFRTMEVPQLAGRGLLDSDSTTAGPVVVINEAARRRFFGERDPVGQQIRFWGASRRVVGVVGNERFQGLTETAAPAVYAPLDQAPSAGGDGVLLVRSAGAPGGLAPEVRAAIRRLDPGLAVFGLEPLGETAARSTAQRRFTMLVVATLAGVALLLAAAGVHGALSYAVGQRTREIGVRMALGAQADGIRRLVVREGLGLAVAGVAIGLPAALALARLIGSLLYGVTPGDPLIFGVVPLVLVAVAGAASYLPARRATRVDPIVALRSE